MVDFKLVPIKHYTKLVNNKASQQFISLIKDVLKQAPGYVTSFLGTESVKQAAAAAASHKINLKGHVQKYQKQPERGVLRNLVLWKWLFHNAGEMNFWLKSLKNILEDVHLYLSCMLLSYNFTKKRTTSFSIF